MSNALAIATPFRDLFEQAQTLVKSGFLPRDVNTAEKAVAIMTMGQEVGIGMWAAFNGISVIQQKPTMGPQLMLGLINRSGQLEDMTIDSTDEGCTVTMKRKGRSPHTETFGRKQAQDMGLLNKDNYKKQPAVMYKWRAVSACARIVFPDVVMGFYLPEEINPDIHVDADGEWNRDYAPQYQPQAPQLPQSDYQDYEEVETGEDAPQDAPQGEIRSELDDYGIGKPNMTTAAAVGANTGDISDLLDLVMRDCAGPNMYRILEYSKANSNTNHSRHWENRKKAWFGKDMPHQLSITVREFIETMATSHSTEATAA